MNTEIANLLLEHALQKAEELQVSVSVAVVDDSAFLAAFTRMDGTFKGSVDVAIGKARTAALFPLPTEHFGEAVNAAGLTGIELSNGGLMCFAGGLPLFVDGGHVGAVGVSGGTAEQDSAIAAFATETTLAAL